MANFDMADGLLAKRCSYLESALRFPEHVHEHPPQGYIYKHFVLQGVVHAAYYTGNGSAYSQDMLQKDVDVVRHGGSHARGIYCVSYETPMKALSIPLTHLRDYGLDPSQYAADEYLGEAVRTDFAERLHSCLNSVYGTPSGGAENITQQYKGRELFITDTTASWEEQKADLIQQVAEYPLSDLLSQQAAVDANQYVYAWSARKAGFPARQFQGNARHVLSPNLITRLSSWPYLNSNVTMHAVQSNPTLALVTVAVPENYDTLVAGETNASIDVLMSCRHITTPHWMGFAGFISDRAIIHSSENYLYDSRFVRNFSSTLTAVAVYNSSDESYTEHGDVILYTPMSYPEQLQYQPPTLKG